MGKAIVATTQVIDVSALNDLLTRLQFGETKYYLLQKPNKITDWTEGTPDTTKIEKFSHGRLFGRQAELRWQKTNTGYTLLWLSEDTLPEGFTEQGEWETTHPQDIHLLGGGETKPWRDTRIPRDLDYPIDWCKYPCVKVIQYKEKTSQTIRFTRFTAFVQKSGD
jgi:hypothetical protein